MIVDDAAVHLARQAEAHASLYWFTRYGFQQQYKRRWLRNWHHQAICDQLQRVYDGHCRRLIINIPPRYSKTEIAVVNFMAWALGRQPDAEFIHTSYSARLAVGNSARCRQLVRTKWYRALFPALRLAIGSSAKEDWRTTAGGVVYATGAGGTITGYGAGKKRDVHSFGGAIIIDDPHKADEAASDTVRRHVIDWFKNTLESRVNSPETPIVLVMQRLHEEDLTGWLLAGGNGEMWDHLCIPAIGEDGAALWPATHSLEALQRMEQAKPYEFAGQYMQRPAPLGGGIFKTGWWRYYRAAALPKVRRVVQSWDTAFKTKAANDYSVCTTWAEGVDGNIYAIDRWKAKVEYPELKRMAISLAAKHKPHAILVEDKASGQSLVQELRRESTGLSIVPIRVDTDKVARAFAVTPVIESGRVFLPEGAEWIADYVVTMGTFPNGAHDDDVDSTTQALAYLTRGGGAMGFLEFMRGEAESLENG
jgi:predicted phage terminase large subunit-like protein